MSSPSKSTLQPVAIVGIATELPSGSTSNTNLSYTDLFAFLECKGEAYETIPYQRYATAGQKPFSQRIVTDTGAFLKDIGLFDPLEFSISARDAKGMSVGTRKLIELSFLALYDSEIDYRGQNVGCYMTAELYSTADPNDRDSQGSFAGYPYMVANKVSYHLDLTGPSFPIQTACSSSAVATHVAVQALRAGECEAAVVGACQLNLREEDWIQYSEGHVLAPDGKCKPMDASANGFSKGEGAVVVVLKLLEDAIRDGDHIYASILGTGVTSTGSIAPVSAPVASFQAKAMQIAFQGTGKRPQDVDFVELHATGTAAGDPVEANWVGEHFKRDDTLQVGSIKGNFGHLECAAFLASLAKACSMFEKRLIPPTTNLNVRNPKILWDEFKMNAAITTIPLPCAHGKSSISINSSGIGGVNGHALVEASPLSRPDNQEQSDEVTGGILFVAGGLSPKSAAQICETVSELTTQHPTKIAHMSTAYGRRCRQMTWRSFGVLNPGKPLKFSTPVLSPRRPSPIVFVFSGQGSQHVNMGREFFKRYTVFRQSVLQSDMVFQKATGYSFIERTGLFDTQEHESPLGETWPIAVISPAMAIFQIALVDLLESLGVVPDSVVGHSAGETSVVYASGAGSRALTIELAIARGNAMAIVEGADRGMAAFGCSSEIAQDIINKTMSVTDADIVLDVACYNSPNAVIISGHESGLKQAMEYAQEQGIFNRRLRTSTPVHSRLMLEAEEQYNRSVEEVFSKHGVELPRLKTYSTVTGDVHNSIFTPSYFWQNAASPVLFTAAISSILRDAPSAAFIEIGPHPALLSYIDNISGGEAPVMAAAHRTNSENTVLLQALGKLTVLGHNCVDFHQLNSTPKSKKLEVPLPPYPFHRKDMPYFSGSMVNTTASSTRPLLNDQLISDAMSSPQLTDHYIRNESIMPAAGYVEMLLQSGATCLSNVTFESAMIIGAQQRLKISLIDQDGSWSIVSTTRNADNTYESGKRVHAKGLKLDSPWDLPTPVDFEKIHTRDIAMHTEEFYRTLSYFAQYGPWYQRLLNLSRGQNEWIAEIKGLAGSGSAPGYVFHPALLDACIHAVVHPYITGNADKNSYYLPAEIQLLALNGQGSDIESHSNVFSFMKLTKWLPDSQVFDVTITTGEGKVLLQIIGLKVDRHEIRPGQMPSVRYDMSYKSVDASSPHPNGNGNLTGPSPDLATLVFFPGQELQIWQSISRFQQQGYKHIYVQALKGLDSATAEGFCRSLNKELLDCHIHLVIFDDSSNSALRLKKLLAISQIDALKGELEVFVARSGEMFVPRIEAVSVPTTPVTLNTHVHQYWEVDANTHKSESHIVSHPRPHIPQDHVLLKLEEVSSAYFGVRALKAVVCEPGSKEWPAGSEVLGIQEAGNISNTYVAHHSELISCSSTGLNVNLVLPIIVVQLGLGPDYLGYPSRRKHNRVVIADDTEISTDLKAVLDTFGIETVLLGSDVSLETMHVLQKSDSILLGLNSPEAVRKINALNVSGTPLYSWNDRATGARSTLQRDALSKGSTINSAIQLFNQSLASKNLETDAPLKIADIEKSALAVQGSLLSDEKTYLIVGGIGSLGLQIAYWMYTKGARSIVLTSRSGMASLLARKNTSAIRLLNHLQSQSDLTLRLEACDATSSEGMKRLIDDIGPLGGCIMSSVVLSDAAIGSHTPETFYRAFPPKVGAYQVLESIVEISKLDFLIVLSSAATFGSAGQTNYSSANTTVDHMARHYRNAFSLVVPAILDSDAVTHSEDYSTDPALVHWIPWAKSSRELCLYIEDGIQRLSNEEFWLYIPDYNWNDVQTYFGHSQLYNHLVKASPVTVLSKESTESAFASLEKSICDILDIAPEDFSPEIPLTAYGLDSITASRVSVALVPMVNMTQLQLLGDVCWNDIKQRITQLIPEAEAETVVA